MANINNTVFIGTPLYIGKRDWLIWRRADDESLSEFIKNSPVPMYFYMCDLYALEIEKNKQKTIKNSILQQLH